MPIVFRSSPSNSSGRLASISRGQPFFMRSVKVRGDSMTGAGILAGDYVIVRHQESANPGDMVVALIGDEATVKYYQPKGERIELVAANPAYEPIQVRAGEDFRVLGVVRGMIRTVGS